MFSRNLVSPLFTRTYINYISKRLNKFTQKPYNPYNGHKKTASAESSKVKLQNVRFFYRQQQNKDYFPMKTYLREMILGHHEFIEEALENESVQELIQSGILLKIYVVGTSYVDDFGEVLYLIYNGDYNNTFPCRDYINNELKSKGIRCEWDAIGYESYKYFIDELIL